MTKSEVPFKGSTATENNGPKTTKFYNTAIQRNKLTKALKEAFGAYIEQVKKEVADHAGAENDPRLQCMADFMSQEEVQHTVRKHKLGGVFSMSRHYDGWEKLDLGDDNKLVTEDNLPKFRWRIALPVDFSKDLLVAALGKEFGRDIKKKEFTHGGNDNIGDVSCNTFTVSLDKILNAPELNQEPSSARQL